MKKLSLKNVQLSTSNLLSNEEKKQLTGGEGFPGVCYCGMPEEMKKKCFWPKGPGCESLIGL